VINVKGFELGISVNGSSQSVDPQEVSFTLLDSIYSLFPKAVLSFRDHFGYGLESKAYINGTKIEITLNYEENLLKCPYIVNSYETQELSETTQLNGKIVLELIHEEYKNSLRDTSAYRGNPSEIISEIFPSSHFLEDSIFIEDTKEIKDKNLYNPNMTKEDFVKNILLPNAFSLEKSYSPYLCFINSSNEFYFKSIKQLMEEKEVSDLFFDSNQAHENYQEKVFSAYPFSDRLSDVRDSFTYNLSYFSEEDQEYKEYSIDNFNIVEYNQVSLSGSTELTKPSIYFGVKSEKYREKEINNYLFSKRTDIFPERLIITIAFYPECCSGKTVYFNATYGNENSSESFSNKYIIEQSQHIWDGVTKRGLTKLVLATPNPQYSSISDIEPGVYL
jgi:hypothetical protein